MKLNRIDKKNIAIFLTILIVFSTFTVIGIPTEAADESSQAVTAAQDKMIPIIILLRDQYKPIPDRLFTRDASVQSMMSFAEERQEKLLTVLQTSKEVKDIQQFWIINAIACKATPAMIEEIRKQPDVAKVELDMEVRLFDEKEPRFFEAFNVSQTIEWIQPGEEEIAWGVDWIEAPRVWANGINGSGINVSILDTGINAHHPDLRGKVIAWRDFVNNRTAPYDDHGHGTHVAGTVAGTGAGGIRTGVAPGANLFGVKVFDQRGRANVSDVIAGFQWSVRKGADVISYSGGILPIDYKWNRTAVNRTNMHVIRVNDSYGVNMDSFKPAFIGAYVGSHDLQNLSISLIAPNGTVVRGDCIAWLAPPYVRRYVWLYKYSENNPLPNGTWTLNVTSLRENYLWHSGRGNNLNNTLSRNFSLSGVSNATLNFWTRYDIQYSRDKGYVEISIDGINWETLATYTGSSRPYVESLNLSEYAGKNITIRFRYRTDSTIIHPGWIVDNINIPEIRFFDDVERGTGNWSSMGWTIIREPIPYEYELFVFYPDDGTSIQAQVVNRIAEIDGVVPVIAAGNYGYIGLRTIASPGSASKAITVGATGYEMDYIAWFSSRGPVGYGTNKTIKPDVVAPGDRIVSTGHRGGYISMSGTSMATPHVSGTVALMLQANRSLSTAEVKRILENSSFDLGKEGKDNTYGAGRISAYAAVSNVTRLVPIPEVRLYAGHARGWDALVNQPVTLTAISWKDTPVNGTDVRFVVRLWNIEVLNTTNITNSMGLATVNFVPNRTGHYDIIITDEFGNVVREWIWVGRLPQPRSFDTTWQSYVAMPNTIVQMKYTLVTPEFEPYNERVNLTIRGGWEWGEVINVSLTPINGTIAYDLNLSRHRFDDMAHWGGSIFIKNETESICVGSLTIDPEAYRSELYPRWSVRTNPGDRITYLFQKYNYIDNSPAPDREYTVKVFWLEDVEVKSLAERDFELTNKLMSNEKMTKEEEIKLLDEIKDMGANYTLFNISTRNGIATFDILVPKNVYKGFVEIKGERWVRSHISVDPSPWIHHTAVPEEDAKLWIWADWDGKCDDVNRTIIPYNNFMVHVRLSNRTGPIQNATVYLYTADKAKRVITDRTGRANTAFPIRYNASLPWWHNIMQVVGLYGGTWDDARARPPIWHLRSEIDAEIKDNVLNIIVRHKNPRGELIHAPSILDVNEEGWWRSTGTLLSKYINASVHREILNVSIGEYTIRDMWRPPTPWGWWWWHVGYEYIASSPLEILTPIHDEYLMDTIVPIDVRMKSGEANATVYIYASTGWYPFFQYLNITTTDKNGNARLYLKVPSKRGHVEYIIGGANSSFVFQAERDWFRVREQVAPRIVSYIITNRTIVHEQTTKINVGFSELVHASVRIEDVNRSPVRTLFIGNVTRLETTWDGRCRNNSLVPHGIYYVNVTGTNMTTRLSVMNNRETINVRALKPDIIGRIEVPRYIKKYKNDLVAVNATFIIENIGTAATTRDFYVRATLLDISRNLTITDRIRAGGNITFRINVVVWPGGPKDMRVTSYDDYNHTIEARGNISLDNHTLILFMDAKGHIGELNETNNNVTATVTVTRPDLVPMLTVPTKEVAPGVHNVSVGVRNIGHVYAVPTQLMVVIKNASDIPVYNRSFDVPRLDAIGGRNSTWTKNVPPRFVKGVYNISVIANSNRSEAETNYMNNIITRQVTVIQLSPINVTVSSYFNVPHGETRNSSIILENINETHRLGSLSLTLSYDPSVAIAVGNSSVYAPNVTMTTRRIRPDLEEVRIIGSGLNISGTITLANITFRAVDDIGRSTLLDLEGRLTSVGGFDIPMNITDGNFTTMKTTDLMPSIRSYPRMMVGMNNTISVDVRNLRHTSSDNFSLNVSVFNMTTRELVRVLLNETYPGIPAFGGRTISFVWNASVPEDKYWINATLYNDTITRNNKASRRVSVEEYKLDAHTIWYPSGEVRRNTTFWIGGVFNASHPGFVNASIELPSGLELASGENRSKSIHAWASNWNSVWWRVNGTRLGEYGNRTANMINITVEAMDKRDRITTNESPSWKLRINVPMIWVHSMNSTVLNAMEQKDLLFRTVNVETINQSIRIAIQSGVDGRTLTGLDYLVHYPWGCVEQVTSIMLGALHTAEYYRGREPAGYNYERVNRSVHSGINRLSINGSVGQRANGSWAMWGGRAPQGDEFHSIYASYGLGRVKQDGWFGGNVTIGDRTRMVNFSKTVEWFEDRLIARNNGSHWHTRLYYPGTVRITAFGMMTHYQMHKYGELRNEATANESMRRTTEYLLWAQNNTSGGWGEINWDGLGRHTRARDDAMSTAMSVWALKLYGMNSTNVSRERIEAAIKNGTNWLHRHQTRDGSWTAVPGHFWDWHGLRSETTGLALLSLNESNSIGGLNLAASTYDISNETMWNGTNYLIGTYRQRGSWGHTRATQIAIHALTKLQPAIRPDANISVSVNGMHIGTYRVNGTNPVRTVELNRAVIRDLVMNNTTRSAGGKRFWHTVSLTYESGSGPVIIGVANEQLVPVEDVVGEVTGGRMIMSVGERFADGSAKTSTMSTKMLLTNFDEIKGGSGSGNTSEVEIGIITPDIDGDGVVEVIITNKNESLLLSPIVEIPLSGMTFTDTYPVNLTWANISRYPILHEYDAMNNTLRVFPDEVPAMGSISVKINATLNSGNNTFEVRVTPMYNELMTFIGNITKYVRGHGNVTVNVYNETETRLINATVEIGAKSTTSGIQVRTVEGSYLLNVTKEGYEPVNTSITIDRGDRKNVTVKLYREANLRVPKVVFTEGDIYTLNIAAMMTVNETVIPNAMRKAARNFVVNVTGVGKTILAVRVPEYRREDLSAPLDENITVTNATRRPIVNGTMFIEVNGSKDVQVQFVGRMLGDVSKDGRVNIVDAMFIAQYDVGLRIFDSPTLAYADVSKGRGVTIVDAMFIAQYDVGLRNANYE